ncbi:MAG: TraB/GumN family protein [Chloroflexi bacterium]|nr:TraB/GumN family protein [Chloroflexota bacterium]
MNKYASSFIILLLLFIIIPGCSTSEDTKEPYNSFLWEVTSDTTTVYVVGSVHIASSDLYPLADAIEDAFDQAENVAAEFDVTSFNEMEATALMMEKGMYSGGDTLRDHIPQDLYEKTDELLDDLDFNIFFLRSFEPWVIAMEIEVLVYEDYGYTGDYGIDQYFLNKAHEEGKDIIDLESAEFQINLFDSFSEDQHILLLEDAVENIPTKKEIKHMFEVWETGNTVEMEKIMFEDLDEHPEFIPISEELIDKRNFGMVEKIEGFLEDDEIYFVVVGAGHLVGENGIINLLGEKGYPTVQL